MERFIKQIQTENGETFYSYFDGDKHVLDRDFNKFIASKDEKVIGSYISKLTKDGHNVKVGPNAPVEATEGEKVSIEDKNLLGIWGITTPKEKNMFRALLLSQEAQKAQVASSENNNKPATWIKRY